MEKDIAVFLKFSDEAEQLLIEKNQLDIPLKEGDIVEITSSNGTYHIVLLEKETQHARERVQSLIEQLKNRNK